MKYYLMNKNAEVGTFELRHGTFGDEFRFEHTGKSPLPIGFDYIEKWIENRKASKHNAHLKQIMADCGCDKTEGFIKITHAASINDTFWIKSEHENVSWERISFYRNPFDETISKMAFEGMGLYGIKMSETSPELSTDGSFRKCWMREDNGQIFLYKRGSDGARNAGLEPYCEVMASEVAQRILGQDAIPYQLVRLHGELASKCPLFTNETYGYVPISRFPINHSSPESLMRFYAELGSETLFRKMIVLDSLTFNVDRHAGNHGVLVENDTQKPIRMAPVFDLNLSMLPYIERSDWEHIGTKMRDYGPRIGEDFTRIGQQAMTSEIRAILIGMKSFQFSFRGDEKIEPERVKLMEQMIHKQIEALLSREVLYTKDVFVPEHSLSEEQEKPSTKTEPERQSADKEILAETLWKNQHLDQWFSGYLLEDSDRKTEMILYSAQNPREEVHLDLSTGETTLFVDEEPINAFEAADEHEELCAAATKAEIAYGRELEPERTEQEKIQAQEQE